jgi:hypothetical protein
MTINPYAPPTSNVESIPAYRDSPAIWNPGAAAKWSLLFSPVFGAIIQMKNWQALGEPDKAREAKHWAWGSIGFFVVMMLLGVLLPDSKALDVGSRGAGLGLLVVWYLMSAKSQVSYVTARFGNVYPRRNWGLPILYAVLCFAAFVAIVFAIAVVVGLLQGEL